MRQRVDRSGTFSGEAIRPLILIAAPHAALDWAIKQGLLLTILLGIGAVICAVIIYAAIRVLRRSHSLPAAMNRVWRAIADFLIAGVGAVVIVLLGLFVWFFIREDMDRHWPGRALA